MSPRRPIPQQKEKEQFPPWLIFGGLFVFVVVAVLVAADFWTKIQPPTPSSPSGTALNGIPANGRTLGDSKAPVAMVEYSDFQ